MQIFVQLRNPVSRIHLLAGGHGHAVGGDGGDREDLCFTFKDRDNKGELKLNFSDLFDFCSSWMIKRRKDYLIWIVVRHRFLSTY